jgi:hypothetical protein
MKNEFLETFGTRIAVSKNIIQYGQNVSAIMNIPQRGPEEQIPHREDREHACRLLRGKSWRDRCGHWHRT